MPGPFYNAIKGTTGSAPGTGNFTPNAAASGFLAWTGVPNGWFGLVRFEDGSAWELRYCYWNGTLISRPTGGFVASSTGSALSLGASATAALVNDANEVGPDFSSYPARGFIGVPNSSGAPTVIGIGTITNTGTLAASVLANTNFATRQPRSQIASATTANAQAGFSFGTGTVFTSSTAGIGGWSMTARFGAVAALPSGPRLFVGMAGTTFVGVTTEPSAFVANYAVFGKDSTDTNIQLLTNSNASGGTKIDTGIPLVAGAWYEGTLWSEPGSLTINSLLCRLDTGAIDFRSTATDVPVADVVLFPQMIGGLSATTGTAFTLGGGHHLVRTVT